MEPVYPSPFSPLLPDIPSANIMKPICDMVLNASTLLISVCVQAMMAAITADITPIHVTKFSTAGSIENTGNNLATKNTPATTMVAACINAETGVGPSMASGNQICKGNIADLPAPPININHNPKVNIETPRKEAVVIPINSADWAEVNLSISKPKSSVPL